MLHSEFYKFFAPNTIKPLFPLGSSSRKDNQKFLKFEIIPDRHLNKIKALASIAFTSQCGLTLQNLLILSKFSQKTDLTSLQLKITYN